MVSEIIKKYEKDLSKTELEVLSNNIDAVVCHRVTKRTLVCVVTTKSGFESHGVSKVRNENQFDRSLGELYALKNALRHVIKMA